MKHLNFILITIAFLVIGVYIFSTLEANAEKESKVKPETTREAVFAGGCFWCTESDFEKVNGVVDAISGYTGGQLQKPTYKQVSGGGTGHVEAVKVIYDPTVISYADLLEIFWHHVDPTDPGGQFVDRGSQYRSVIFYATDQERQMAEASKERLAASGRFDTPIATEILPLGDFYTAEDYHQNYYKKNPIRYQWYRSGSGRDQFLKKAWADNDAEMTREGGARMKKTGDGSAPAIVGAAWGMEGGGTYTPPSDEELRNRLTPMQYKVTRQDETEPPFNNEYWNHHEEGIYVDIVSGEPLFSSKEKFDSGTGWPSFTKPLVPDNIVEKTDRSFFMERTEVRSKHADSHLGHVFKDGPAPTGLRYCINSAALRFIPRSDLEKEGYGAFRKHFE